MIFFLWNALLLVMSLMHIYIYIYDMCKSIEFAGLRSLGELAQNLICSKRSGVYPSVY